MSNAHSTETHNRLAATRVVLLWLMAKVPVISLEFGWVQRYGSDQGVAQIFLKCVHMLGVIWSLSGGQTGSIVTRPGRGGNQISSWARWRCVWH